MRRADQLRVPHTDSSLELWFLFDTSEQCYFRCHQLLAAKTMKLVSRWAQISQSLVPWHCLNSNYKSGTFSFGLRWSFCAYLSRQLSLSAAFSHSSTIRQSFAWSPRLYCTCAEPPRAAIGATYCLTLSIRYFFCTALDSRRSLLDCYCDFWCRACLWQGPNTRPWPRLRLRRCYSSSASHWTLSLCRIHCYPSASSDDARKSFQLLPSGSARLLIDTFLNRFFG